MKVALVHDYIKEYGGAERVLEALHEVWPDAPVFTTVYIPEFLGPHEERFKNWDIRTSFLQYLPFKEKLISPFRLISPFVFRSFDFSQFDVVIVSATGAYTPNSIKVKSQKSTHSASSGLRLRGRSDSRRLMLSEVEASKVKTATQNSKMENGKWKMENQKSLHICYCHTPPRYLYGYATAREWKKNLIFKVLGEIANHFLRLIDFKSSQNVDFFIANSKNVAERIRKFYRRESTVIYPPIQIPNSKSQIPNKSQNTKYFLAGGRIARPKHIDFIVETFRKLDLPLVVFGREFAGSNNLKTQNSKLKTTAQNSKVEFVGEVSDEDKLELMRNAKAFIFAGEDEDFGITPVEAMSVGTPVIAYRSGGVLETVIENSSASSRSATGLFFDELSVESLSKAIQQFSNLTINPLDCIRQAQKFSKERFKKEILTYITKVL